MTTTLFCVACGWGRALAKGEKYRGYPDGSPADACPRCGRTPLGLLRT